jgi:hypothetical protein
MKLIIIGNGFDLSHNYKTSFNDFKSHLENSKLDENLLLVKHINQLVEKHNKKNELQWNNFEEIIGHRLNPSLQFNDMKELNIVSIVERFTEKFHTYILSLIENQKIITNNNLAKEFEDVSSILSFNYTSLYTNYLKDKNDINIFHIHGEMDNNNLPIIGYYYDSISKNSSADYLLKYGNRAVHKPALALKQNEQDLDISIYQYKRNLEGRISEIVIMGYSFGDSDSHIYDILNKVMIWQTKEQNIPFSKSKDIRIINFKIYSYNDNESEALIEKIKKKFKKIQRRISTNVTGIGFSSQKKDLITFELVKY